jgi:glycosyltransferase involved in cell wall biosynthesis
MNTATSQARVTALLPAYNAGDFIQATLDSLSAQNWPHFEVLVSVDQSADDTAERCLAHARRDPRFTVIQQPQRLGWVGNCNYLLQQAAGDYALFAFHDDILAPDYVAKLSTALDAHPAAVLAYSDVALTNANGAAEHWVYTELDGVIKRTRRGMKMLRRVGKWWVPNRGVFRLASAQRIGGLKRHGAGEFSADWPWLTHMSLLGEFVRVPETLCFKFYKPGSLSRTWEFSDQQWIEAAASCMREIWNSELTTAEKLQIAQPLADALLKACRQERRG